MIDFTNQYEVDIGVSFDWVPAGMLSLDNQGEIKFPKVEAKPGLYRFDISAGEVFKQYIGETDRLSRRFQQYRSPDLSQDTNMRLNAKVIEQLALNRPVSLSLVTEGVSIKYAGRAHYADLSVKSERILIEAAALFGAKAAGIEVLNI